MTDGPGTAIIILLVVLGVLLLASLTFVMSRRRDGVEAPSLPEEEAPPAEPPVPEAPPAPEVEAPLVPEVEAPLVPEVEAPLVPEVEAPLVSEVEAPLVSEVEAPLVPEVEAPLVPAPPVEVPKRGRVRSIGGAIAGLFKRGALSAEDWEELEEILLRADVGVAATSRIVAALRDRKGIQDGIAAMKEELLAVLGDVDRTLHRSPDGLTIWLIAGVNGSGKTTTIGKLAARLRGEGSTVVLAAADTFRAAADEQLEIWGERAGAQVIKHQHGADPAAVVFDGVAAARARGADVLIVDTAGRLQNKRHLMEELSKIRRVLEREAGPPHEAILVLDATTGQNGLQQARAFFEAVAITGVALTKLDGTAKGGIVVGVQQELGIPVKLVGLGEGIDDLAPFDPGRFVDELLET